MSAPTIKSREAYPYAVVRAGGKLPRFRYQEVGEAGEEAERQSKQRPGATFIVMKEIARVSTKNTDPAAIPPAAGGAGRHHTPKPSGSNLSEFPNGCPKGGA